MNIKRERERERMNGEKVFWKSESFRSESCFPLTQVPGKLINDSVSQVITESAILHERSKSLFPHCSVFLAYLFQVNLDRCAKRLSEKKSKFKF